MDQVSSPVDPGQDIAMLRTVTKKLMAIAADYQDIDQATQALQSVGQACIHLASLLEAQSSLMAGSNSPRDLLSHAVANIDAELQSHDLVDKDAVACPNLEVLK